MISVNQKSVSLMCEHSFGSLTQWYGIFDLWWKKQLVPDPKKSRIKALPTQQGRGYDRKLSFLFFSSFYFVLTSKDERNTKIVPQFGDSPGLHIKFLLFSGLWPSTENEGVVFLIVYTGRMDGAMLVSHPQLRILVSTAKVTTVQKISRFCRD